MTFTELSKKIATCYNSLPALVDALRDGFANVEGGGGGGSSDIEYSTTERKIGKWIDGSDVYSITINYETPFNIASHEWYTSTETYNDIDIIIHADVINSSGANYTGLIVTVDNNKLTIGNQTFNQPVNNVKYVILQYTKSN